MEDALPGRPSPLGATPRDGGINFAATLINEDGWNDPEALALGVYLDGSDAPDTGPDGQPLLDDDFLVLVNGWWEPLEFTIPDCRPGLTWHAEIDTFNPAAAAAAPGRKAGEQVRAGPRSVLVLRGLAAG